MYATLSNTFITSLYLCRKNSKEKLHEANFRYFRHIVYNFLFNSSTKYIQLSMTLELYPMKYLKLVNTSENCSNYFPAISSHY